MKTSRKRARWALAVAMMVAGCGPDAAPLAPADDQPALPSFSVGGTPISFDIVSLAYYYPSGMIIGDDCSGGTESTNTTLSHYVRPDSSEAWVVATHHRYGWGALVSCDTFAGTMDVQGWLDGTYRYYASGVKLNGLDDTLVEDFPTGQNVTVAVSPNSGCSFIALRKDNAWYGTTISTSASSNFAPESGKTYYAVVECPD